jgi:hypothetical protein
VAVLFPGGDEGFLIPIKEIRRWACVAYYCQGGFTKYRRSSAEN